MKISAMLAVLGILVVMPVSAQVGGLKGQVGGLSDAQGGKTEKAKAAYRHKVLQVLPEGLLMSTAGSPYLLVGYPDQAKTADGELIKFYGIATEKTFQYEAVNGHVKTVRIVRFVSKLIGK